MSTAPRVRACRFSSATPGAVPSKSPERASRCAWKTPSIGTTSNRIPRLAARARESSTEPSELYLAGIEIPHT